MIYIKKYENFEFDDDDFDIEEEYPNYDDEWETIRNEFEWTTANKKKIKLKDMDDDHIVNCINWINKHKSSYGRTIGGYLINKFSKELVYRKGMNENFEFDDDDFDIEEESDYELVVLKLDDGELYGPKGDPYVYLKRDGKPYSYNMYNVDKIIRPRGKFIPVSSDLYKKVINNNKSIHEYTMKDGYLNSIWVSFNKLPTDIQNSISYVNENFEFDDDDFDIEEEDPNNSYLEDFLNGKSIKIYRVDWNEFVDKNPNLQWADRTKLNYDSYKEILEEEVGEYDIDIEDLDDYIRTDYVYIKKDKSSDYIIYDFDTIGGYKNKKDYVLFKN